MDWGMFTFLALVAMALIVTGLACDYSNSIDRGWTPIVDGWGTAIKKFFGIKK